MRKVIRKAINPLQFFFNDSMATGVILLLCTVCSLMLTNFSHGDWYKDIWESHSFYLSSLNLPESFCKWINDFLMTFFFLLAGMEIKRELATGELSSFQTAILPFG